MITTSVPPPACAGELEPAGGVTIVVDQLRRAVPGGIGTYATSLVAALGELDSAARPPLRLFASRPRRGVDPLAELGLPLGTSSLPERLLTRAWDVGIFPPPFTGGVVHATSLAAPRTSDALVVTVHDLAFRALPHTFTEHGRRWHEAALRHAAARAAACVVPSAPVKDALADAGIGGDRVTVIEEGADHLPPADDAAARALLAALGIADGFLLTVGTREPRKNLPRLFAAYAAARRELPEPWPLLVCGPEGWLQDDGSALPDGVVLAGHVAAPVLAALYRWCRVFAYVPLLEGFGLPVAEAMHAGAVVVSSAVPASSGAAFEADPLDVDAIAHALVVCSSDDACRARLVDAGTTRAGTLTWRSTALAHVALWQEVARSTGRR